MVDLDNKLKSLRKEKGLTQQQVAERINISKAMVSSYELATRVPPYATLVKLARLYNVSTDYLLGVEKSQFINADGLNAHQLSLLNEIIEEFKAKK